MAAYYPMAQNISLPGTPANADDVYITNAHHTYDTFNGNGAQDTGVTSGGAGVTYVVTNNSTATFSRAFNLNGANVIVDSGSSIVVDGDFTNADGGHVLLNGAMTVDGDTNFSTARITVKSGGILTARGLTNLNSVDLVIDGGVVDFRGALANDSGAVIDFKGNPNGILKIDTGRQLNDVGALTIRNFATGDQIEVTSSAGGTLTTTYSNGALTIRNAGGTTVATFNVTGASGSSGASPVSEGNGYLVVAGFLAGARIRTPDGDAAVEDVRIGDRISCYESGAFVSKAVRWAGRARCRVRDGLPDDEAGYPVCVLKGALADGVPSRDMRITPAHGLFLEEKFIPVRMLVNGRSIFYDRRVSSYDYYHVEVEDHSVIMSDGVLTESYRDTGTRSIFRASEGTGASGDSRGAGWNDAADPLCVDRAFVEPIFRAIQARSEKGDVPLQTEPPALTWEADLHLVTKAGAVIHHARATRKHVIFMVPGGIPSVRIQSNASRPCDVIGPFVDDRRYFGVEIGEILLFESERNRVIPTHLEVDELPGWSARQGTGSRWTNGSAVLPLGVRRPNSVALLALEIRAAGPYALHSP